MFQKLKKIFSKKEQVNDLHYTNQIINFKDLALQDIEISIQPDGNSTALVIKELKNNYKIVLDKETCLLLSLILSQYYKKENINSLLNLFERD